MAGIRNLPLLLLPVEKVEKVVEIRVLHRVQVGKMQLVFPGFDYPVQVGMEVVLERTVLLQVMQGVGEEIMAMGLAHMVGMALGID